MGPGFASDQAAWNCWRVASAAAMSGRGCLGATLRPTGLVLAGRDALAAYADTVTGEERRVLTLAAVLLGADPVSRPEAESRRAAA